MKYITRLKIAIIVACTAFISTSFADSLIESKKLLKGFVHPPLESFAGTEHDAEARKYQGIPSIERAANGRLWAAWYAGPYWEDKHNYIVVATSDDDGETWSDVCLVIDPDGDGLKRAADPCFWMAPDGTLWLFWWMSGDGLDLTMAITASNPDDKDASWSEPRALFPGVMMNKPIVNSAGEWLMPTAIWHQDNSSRLIVSKDEGRTWYMRGAANVPKHRRNCDEPMIVERKDGSLVQLIRTSDFGIAKSISEDGGRTWTEAEDYLKDATSRFFFGRLPSGNLLLVKHGPLNERVGRSHLTAYLSDDDGESWQGGLVLDERSGISYPDVAASPDGDIYVIYDWNRSDEKHILMSKFTERDVLSKSFASDGSRQKVLVNQATGVNDKSWLEPGNNSVLNDNKQGDELLLGSMAVLDVLHGEIRPVLPQTRIFSDRKYDFNDNIPDYLKGKQFVYGSINGSKAVCTEAGVIYVLTPTPTRNKDSLTKELEAQGFSLVAVSEYLPFSDSMGNICSLYQKHLRQGEVVELGKWGILLF